MRVRDALSAVRTGKKKEREMAALTTVWSEQKTEGAILPEHPRPQMRRDEWESLNGWWHYAFTKKSGRPDTFDGRILVPFSPESARSGVGKRLEPGQYLWYFRSVKLESLPKGKRLLLHFGAVDERCIVWWNGRLLGSHRNGYLTFSFDVTQHVREGTNTIWVRVQDDTDASGACRGKQSLAPGGMFYTAHSGIWQTVWLEWVPENFIANLKITPLYDSGAVRIELSAVRPADAKIRIRGKTSSYLHFVKKEDFTVNGDAQAVRADGIVNAAEEKRAEAVMEITLPELCPWSPEDPFLYGLETVLGEDLVESYFAMRKFSVGTDSGRYPRLMLNNRPYFFHGVLDQGYWPESLCTPPDDEAMVFDIVKMKELGFNMIRKHVKIEPMRWYYHCDRIGMIVWQDMVNGGGRLDLWRLCYLPTALPAVTAKIKDDRYRFFARSDARERKWWEEDCLAMIRQLYNCPCIAMWVPFNEGWGQFDSLRITDEIRKADATRLVDHASGWFDQGGGDVKSVHNYFRPLKAVRDKRPFVLSEYGGYSCAVLGHTSTEASYGYRTCRTEEEFSDAFWKLQEKIRSLEKKGLCGAVYTQVSDIEEEINGLYTYDRKKCKVAGRQNVRKKDV